MRASTLQILYSIRSERLLCEQLDYNLLFRWFVGLSIDEPIWDHSTFTKNRDRLIEAKVAPSARRSSDVASRGWGSLEARYARLGANAKGSSTHPGFSRQLHRTHRVFPSESLHHLLLERDRERPGHVAPPELLPPLRGVRLRFAL